MKTLTLLTAVSAMALGGISTAYATDVRTETEIRNDNAVVTEQELEKGWDDTKDAVSGAAKSVSDATKETYYDIKAAIQGDNDSAVETISVKARTTADGMLGQTIYNTNGDRVATIRDIILDENGKAMMVVLGDGDFTGLGKLAAFDYSVVTDTNAEGDMVTTLNETDIDNAASFSYNRDEYDDDTRIIPSNGYSVSELMDADLVDAQGNALADIDNFVFQNGQITQIITSYGGVMGVNEQKIAIAFDEADIVRLNNDLHFQLSAEESMDFENHKSKSM